MARGAPWGTKHRGGCGEPIPAGRAGNVKPSPSPLLFPLPAQHSQADGAPGALPWGCPGWDSPGPVSQVTGNWRRGSRSRLESPDSCTHQYGRSPNRNLGRDSSGREGQTDRQRPAGRSRAGGGRIPAAHPGISRDHPVPILTPPAVSSARNSWQTLVAARVTPRNAPGQGVSAWNSRGVEQGVSPCPPHHLKTTLNHSATRAIQRTIRDTCSSSPRASGKHTV